MPASAKYIAITLGLLRVAAAFVFVQHGAQKLFGMLDGSPASLVSLFGLAGVLEFFGGLLILLGLFTRPVAFILSGEMAVAYFRTHAPRGFWTIQNGGELAVLFCFLFLFLAAMGGGDYSLDALVRKQRRH